MKKLLIFLFLLFFYFFSFGLNIKIDLKTVSKLENYLQKNNIKIKKRTNIKQYKIKINDKTIIFKDKQDFYKQINKNFKKEIIKQRNSNSFKIAKILKNKNKYCKEYYKGMNSFFNLLYLLNNKINLQINFIDLLACDYNNLFWPPLKISLKAKYLKYRYTNITTAINNNTIFILRKNDVFDTIKYVFHSWFKYVNWLAIINNKIEKIRAGGTCWIATILYQTVLHILPQIQILERYPHSQYYKEYYWPIYWLDATIFDWKFYKKNFKFKYIGNINLILKGFNTKPQKGYFKYWFFIYSPYIKTVDKIDYKFLNKGCVLNRIYYRWNIIKKIKSCYKIIK